MKHIISLGAGVQSSTMALMAAHGEITPMPEAAIFADTGSEPAGVMRWLDEMEKLLPFPVYRVMKDQGLRENIISALDGGRFAGAPFYTESDRSAQGKLRRQCTKEFKLEPITKKIRELLGIGYGERAPKEILVTQWIGISMDEAWRMKPCREHYIESRWPLIELRVTRAQCLQWMKEHHYPAPAKSACTFCPYHDDALWRDMKMNDPVSFADAVRMDEMIRNGVRGTKQRLYLHRSMKPLAEVDFRSAEDAGQLSMFNEECEGMCGT